MKFYKKFFEDLELDIVTISYFVFILLKNMVIYTVGTFDLLHVGHLALLQHCKTMGDTLIVGLASDNVVGSYKPNMPIIPLAQRMEMIKSLGCVDDVRSYDELEYISACKELDVDIFVIGEDWGDDSHNIAVEKFLKSKGKKIIQVSYDPQTSTTKIKQDVLSQFYKVSNRNAKDQSFVDIEE